LDEWEEWKEMVRRLTDRQEEVLSFITGYLDRQGYPPTLKEIAAHFGMASPNAVRDHLRALEGKGFLRRAADKSRAMLVLGRPHRGFPLIGEVAAGSPVTAEENRQGFVDLGDFFGRDSGSFVHRVKGDSMIGAGIHEGDLVVVNHQPTLESGDIGVVFLGGEATVKRVFLEGNQVRLQPENDRLSPIVVRRDDPELRIGGRVIGVVRKF
jgi:repressor LexA